MQQHQRLAIADHSPSDVASFECEAVRKLEHSEAPKILFGRYLPNCRNCLIAPIAFSVVVARDANKFDGNAGIDGADDRLIHTMHGIGYASDGPVLLGVLSVGQRPEFA